jgi:hypothetical protein
LGKTSDTRRNPALRYYKKESSASSSDGSVTSDEVIESYHPAYLLQDWSLERAGRGVVSVNSSSKETPKAIGPEPGPSPSFSERAIVSDNHIVGCELSMPYSDSVNEGSKLSVSKVRRAAMIVIGDEILNGFTADENVQVFSPLIFKCSSALI